MSDLPQTATLDLERQGDWLTVWFNSPDENRNALTEARSAELKLLCTALSDGSDIRGVVFRGRGGTFCAGGDLKLFKQAFPGASDRDATVAMSRDAGALYGMVDALPQLTVMAVEGACVAGGMGLASTGDVVIAAQDAHFSLTEVRIGLAPVQIAPFLQRRIGARHTRRLALTGSTFGADEAFRIGLADQLVAGADAMDHALSTLAEQSARCAPGAVADTKAYLSNLAGWPRDLQIEQAAQLFADRMLSDEGREGLASFMEKRAPHWAPAKQEKR